MISQREERKMKNNQWVGVWSTVINNKRKFYIGRHPKGAALVGKFQRLYDPNTGTASERVTYIPEHFQQQPDPQWLYYNTPTRIGD